MEETKNESWLGRNLWILPLICGLLALVGLAFPLVAAHTVDYDPATWEFIEGPRIELRASIIFGAEGAVCWPYFIPYGFVIAGIILTIMDAIFREEKLSSGAMLLYMLAAVMFFVSKPFYGFSNGLATVGQYNYDPDNYYWYVKTYVAIADGRLGIGTILSAAASVLAALTSFSASISKKKIDVRSMVEIAMFCAMAIILDLVFHYMPKLFNQVGSFSVALVPLYIVAIRHGPSRGLMASSLVYGLITCLTDGYGIWLYPLDYFVAFSGVAIIGFSGKQILDAKGYNLKAVLLILLGCFLAGVVRFVGSAASSMINYGYTFAAASLVNIYAVVSSLLCALVLIALYLPLLRLNKRFPVDPDGAR